MYEKLVNLFKQNGIPFREVMHAAEGRCDVVSQLRGNELSQAAKAMVVMVKHGKKDRKYYLAVVPADQQIDLKAIQNYSKGDGALFAPAERANAMTECEMGAVPPFSFNQELKLIVDPSLQKNDEIVFNAGKLDCSFFVNIRDYLKLSQAELVNIAKPDMNPGVQLKK